MVLFERKDGFVRLLGTILVFLVFFGGAPNEAPVADAAQINDVSMVRELLRQGADPNAAQTDGLTALHWSALNNESEMVEILLFAGANPSSTSRLGGYTPLHMASRAGHAEIVNKLLEAGADPNRYTTTGVTSMHFAAESNSIELIKMLVLAGGDVNSLDNYSSRTPLMFASTRNATSAVQALIDLDADLSMTNNIKDYEEIAKNATEIRNRRSRIREAAEDPQPEEEQEGRRGPPGGAGANRSSNPSGYLSTEKVETEKGPKVLSSIQQIGKQGGFTALHYAARDGNMQSARLLIQAGADVNQTSEGDQSSPLLVAVINGNYDLAKELLEAGADPNILSDDEAGPLFATLNIEWSLRTWYPQPQAFRQQETTYLQLMEDLLLAGADPNQRTGTHIWYAAYNAGRMGVDFAGATPFWRAAYAQDVEAMKLLVKYGADHDIWTWNIIDPRRRAFFAALNEGEEQEDPSGLPPVPHGGLGVHPLHAASGVGFGTSRVAQQHRGVPDGWLPAIKYLVEELGVDPNLRDKDGLAALHHSAARGDNETILYLVSQGADVTVISRRGQTTADLANSPEQRAQPHPVTIALLEKLGSKNNHNCRSCGG
jgi:ankyrin repeat protein|tara:strand:+ start:2408 stop:4210 length:1803 start_codon:yes stop_codon:yes gene_type:complete